MTPEEPITVLIVDDHQMFGDALQILLAGEEGIDVLPTMSDAEQALRLVEGSCPDVVLMDVDLPAMDGIEATRRVLDACPGTSVVIITALMDPSTIGRGIAAGATGVLSKQRAADELVATIRLAASGETVFLPHELQAIVGPLGLRDDATTSARLTARELEILQALADGMTTDEIATTFFLSRRTVQGHVQNILTKMGVRSKLEAVLDGLREGTIQLRGVSGRP